VKPYLLSYVKLDLPKTSS